MTPGELLYLRGQVNGLTVAVGELRRSQASERDRMGDLLADVIEALARQPAGELRLKVISGGAESATAPAGQLRLVAGGAS